MKMIDSFEVFTWQDNYSVGIDEIDEQHQKLVQLINKLARGLLIQSSELELKNVFNELTLYAIYHFQSEENVWRKYFLDDEWESAHKKSHENFASDVRKLQSAEHDKPYNEVIEYVLSFLTHWLIIHILETDKRMSIVVHALQSGLPIEEAKKLANQEMSKSRGNIFDSVFSMNNLTTSTLQLIRDAMELQNSNAKRFLSSQDVKIKLKTKGITEREREVMSLVIAGYSSKEIANRLSISVRTVEAHRSHIMKKTGSSNLIELARIRMN